MLIKNYTELATSASRKHALDLIELGITSVLPKNIMPKCITFNNSSKEISINDESFDLSSGRLFVVGGGKAVGKMAETLESIIPPELITAGIVNCIDGDYETEKIKINTAGHPIPDANGVAGVQQMLELKTEYSINERDLIVCLISGGGSALLPAPVDEITLEDKQKVTEQLIISGAEIKEINSVRAKLSKIKGGKLALHFAPVKVISIIISDVVGNELLAIASGPTVMDNTTVGFALDVLKKYELTNSAPAKVIDFLNNQKEKEQLHKPEQLLNCKNYIITDNNLALATMVTSAKKLGYNPMVVTSELKGEPNKIAHDIAQDILNRKYKDYDLLLFGGETTPIITEPHGTGGRNQQFAAVSLLDFKSHTDPWLILSFSSDGSDFIPGVAGAVVDRATVEEIETENINLDKFVTEFDSFNLFKKLKNSLILTDNTGTNVGDLILYILK